MAQTREQWELAHRQNIQNAYKQQFGADITPGQLDSWYNLSPDINQIKGYFSEGFQNAQQSPLAMNKAVTEAKNVWNPVTKAQMALTNQQFDTLKQNIQTQLAQGKEGVASNLASRGLGRSGELGWDTAQLEAQAQQQLGAADLQRTLANAEAVATNAQNIYGMASGTQQNMFNQQLQSQLQAHNFKMDEFNNTWTTAKTQGDLLTNQGFLDLLLDNPELARQLLQSYGIRT